MRRAAACLLVLGALAVLASASASPQRYGGTVTVGLSVGEPDSLDPTLARTLPAAEVLNTLCEKLYQFDGKARIVPQLAASLPQISADKLTYTVALRKGIEFNDGTPFNAQAVAATIQRNQTTPGSPTAADLALIASVATPNPLTVVFHLKARYSVLPLILTTQWIESPAQIAKLGSNFGTDPVCVGPFSFDHRVVGDNVTVVKSPYYYDQGGVYLDKIVFKPATNPAAALAALQAGDLQVIDSVPPSELATINGTPGLELLRRNALGFQGIVINIGNSRGIGNLPYTELDTPLASSPRLRQAFD
jgi:peptide/nickel transport system substrate-binding protein